jgi:hypothetical protein
MHVIIFKYFTTSIQTNSLKTYTQNTDIHTGVRGLEIRPTYSTARINPPSSTKGVWLLYGTNQIYYWHWAVWFRMLVRLDSQNKIYYRHWAVWFRMLVRLDSQNKIYYWHWAVWFRMLVRLDSQVLGSSW